LSYLPVVAYACHQGNFSLKNDRHVHSPPIISGAACLTL
jgi:hypothetical protein